MQRVMQADLFGGIQVAGNVVDKLTAILEDYPEARASYMTAIVLFWSEFDGLERVLGDRTEAFRAWFVERATSPKTLQNRVMEIQNERPDLEAPTDVERLRQRQAVQGPVGR